MVQPVNLPNGDRLNFPDGMDYPAMQDAIYAAYPQYKPEPTAFQIAQQKVRGLLAPAPSVMEPSQVSSGQIKNAQPAYSPESPIGFDKFGINDTTSRATTQAIRPLVTRPEPAWLGADPAALEPDYVPPARPVPEDTGMADLSKRLMGQPSAPIPTKAAATELSPYGNPERVLAQESLKPHENSTFDLNPSTLGSIYKQYGQGIANTSMMGFAPNLAGEPQTIGEDFANKAGDLVGFIYGPGLYMAKGAVGMVESLAHTYGEKTVVALAKDIVAQGATLGAAFGLNSIGAAYKADNVHDAATILSRAVQSGEGMGAIFGAFGRILPDQTLMQIGGRILGNNVALDIANQTTPWDNRTPAQKVYDYALNTYFSLKGSGRIPAEAPQPVSPKPTFSQKELREVLNGKTTPNAPQVAEGMNNGTTNVPVLPEIPASGNDQISGIPGRSGTDGVSGHADVLGEQRNGGTGVGNKIPANPVAPAETRRTPSDAQGENTALTVERRHDEIMRKQVEHMTPEELRHTILNDNLTGIPNRRAYAESPKQPYQASIDVDGLKAVNDNIGHDAGDQLLKQVATALKGKTDSAFHISGDEFIVQGRDERSINATLAAVRRELKRAEINVTLPDGREATLKGIGFSFGVDKDLAKAEQKLQGDKTSRELKGLRAPRGELPNGLTFKNPENLNTSQELVQKPQENVQVKPTLRDSLVADAYPGRQYVELTPFEKKQIRVLVKAEPERQRLLGERNALPQFGAGKILQREPGQTGIAGGERGRMEQGQQGTETPAQVAQQPEIQKGGGGTQQVPGIKPHIESLLKRLIPASRPDKTGQRLNLRPAIERAKELMAGTRQMTQGELSWWNRTSKGFEGVDAPSGEAARAIAAIVKAGKSEPAPLDIQQSKVLKLPTRLGREIRVIMNPSDEQIRKLIDSAPDKSGVRVVADKYDDIYMWNAYDLAHIDVMQQLGIPEDMYYGSAGFFLNPQNAIEYAKRFSDVRLVQKSETAAKQTDTPEFKRWFGNSKVLGEDGTALAMLHATPNDFNVFKPGGDNTLKSGRAIWFGVDGINPLAAHNINIGSKIGVFKEGVHIIPAFLKIERPLIIDADTKEWARSLFGNNFPQLISEHTLAEIKKDYDGIMYYDSHNKLSEAVVFDPTQIKSAIGNSGAFNPRKANILESSAYNHELIKEVLESRDQREAIVHQVAADHPDWKEPIDQLLRRAEDGKRGGLIIGTSDENLHRAAEMLAKKNGSDVATELGRLQNVMQASKTIEKGEGVLNRVRVDSEDEAHTVADEYGGRIAEDHSGWYVETSSPVSVAEPLQYSVKDEAGKDIMYSVLTKTVEDSKLNKASPEQWLGTLKNAGVKPEEMKWTDTDTWLKEQKGSVSKADLLNHVRENEVQVKETVLKPAGRRNEGYDIREDADGSYSVFDSHGALLNDGFRYRGAAQEWADEDYNTVVGRGNADDVRFGPDTHPDLTTPSGDKGTYRELILTLPAKPKVLIGNLHVEQRPDGNWHVLNSRNEPEKTFRSEEAANRYVETYGHKDYVKDTANFKSSHYPDQPNPIAHVRFDVRSEPTATPEQIKDIGRRIMFAVGSIRTPEHLGNGAPEMAVRKGAVTQEEANQYSASRGFLNVPTEGATRKTLHIAEVQSDWGQEGRRKGFLTPDLHLEERAALQAKLDELIPKATTIRELLANEYGNAPAPQNKLAELKKINAEVENVNNRMREIPTPKRLPAAPFVTNTSDWSMLALRRMIRYAAENGYDKISWDVGQTQADRYDLSKQIGRISAERYSHHVDSGLQDITISIYDKNDNYLLAKHFDAPTDPKIADMVGKEMAQKIASADYSDTSPHALENPSHSWTGLDLQVGGEGMKGFYDNMLVNEVNKYAKKFGGVVRDGEFPRKFFDKESDAHAAIPTHELVITPAMKEAALAGQPMFSKSKTKTQGFYSPELGTAFVNSDTVTPKEASKIILHEMTHASDTNGKMTKLGEEVLRRLDKQGGIPIYNRVIDRMQKAGQEGNPREALNYLVEETLNEARRFGFSKFDSGFFGWLQRQGFGISKTIKGWLANIRAAMYEHGFKIQVKDLTIDDMLAVAVRGMKEVATGKREAAGSVQPEIVAGSEKEKPAMVNVGLGVSGGKKRTPDEVVKTIEDLGVQVLSKNVHVSDTEDTLVAELSRPLTKDELYSLSVANKQKAVPQKFADGSGIVAGPSAEKWGDYNGNYFLLPNGKRASTEPRPGLVKIIGSNFAGKVANGEEWKRLQTTDDARLKSRKNFYVDEGQGVHPEAGLDKNTRQDVTLNNLYDGGKNPLRLTTEPDLNAFESAVLDHGFDGYYVEGAMGRQGRAVLLGDAAKSKLQTSETAAKQTDTPEFKRWFGNSKVVDENGNPKVFYHATDKSFDVFHRRIGDVGIHFGTAGQSNDRIDYLTERGRVKENQTTIPVYLNIVNPLRLRDAGKWNADNLLHELSERFPNDFGRTTSYGYYNKDQLKFGKPLVSTKDIREYIQSKGYDGIVYKNTGEVSGSKNWRLELEKLRRAMEEGDMSYSSPEYKAWSKAMSEYEEYRNVHGEDSYIAFEPTQIKSAIGNSGAFNPRKANILMSKKVITGDTGRDRTPEQLAAFERVGREIEVPTLKDRIKRLWKDTSKGMAQSFADQFAPIEDLNHEAYRLMRQSKGGSGAFAVLLEGGQLKLVDGTYAFDASKKGGVIERLLTPLQGEGDDFFWWVAANRAERLAKEDREHLFTPADIVAMKSLADGKTEYKYTLQFGAKKGSTTNVRSEIYADSLHVFNEFNKNTLDLAEQSGLIDATSRSIWEHEFYVPFYRVTDSDGMRGMNVKQGVVRQQAFKQLKGGTQKLNTDLLENTLLNWSHLLDASAKNRAAKAALEAAEQMGVAHEIAAPEKNSVWFMDKGQKRHFAVDDPAVMVAISSLDYAGLRGPMMTLLGKPKHWMTTAVTASPYFKIRNLIRDSLQSIAVAKLSYNVPKNIKQGFGLTKKGSDEYNNLLASGGMIHFGTMLENRESDRVRALVEKGVDSGTILNNESKLKAFYKRIVEPTITAYNELGDRGEAINRASLYAQLVKQGANHGEAALQARDLLDFSMQGSSTTIRFLTQTVPFLNARIQGLYKLGKAGKVDPVRMSAVVGTVALFSIANMLYYQNDEDWKKREDWDRENYWWFKVGGLAYRVPKPFEVGAIASLAEHGLELRTNDEMTGKRFATRLYKLLENNLSLNPIPQTVKPLLDVYSNTDNFTGRQIESDAMQKLEPPYRFNAGTSMLARGASSAGNAATANNFLSPIQIDHLIQGYFAWLGTFVVQAGDIIARPVTGQPVSPAIDAYKKASGGLVANLDGAQNRYVTQMYEQAKEVEQVYGTYMSLKKKGGSDAAIYGEAHKEEIGLYHGFEKSKSVMSKLNNQIHAIEQSRALSADEKRKRILSLQTQKGLVAKRMSVAATRPAR